MTFPIQGKELLADGSSGGNLIEESFVL